MTIDVLSIAPLNPAASANGTVSPSLIPMTKSRTFSEDLKCCSSKIKLFLGNYEKEDDLLKTNDGELLRFAGN